ncbi:MAG: hypothetical protein GXX90_08045 [Microbacteriaceae bacterium]|nr:hypothetical protein [Microbacteriaceae bacterium]
MSAPGRIRRRLGALLATLVASALLAGCAITDLDVTASSAGYQPFLPEVRSEDSGLREEFQLSPQEAHEFWSDPERFEEAEGLDYQAPENVPQGGGDPATGAYRPATEPMPASPQGYGTVSAAEVYDRNGLGASTFGRLYTTFDGQSMFVCSATVINSDSGDIVLTAAHCVVELDGSGTVAQGVMFVPGDRNEAQEQPYGMWAAVEVSVPQEFVDHALADSSGMVTSDRGWSHDFAFLKMERQNGQSIQSVTGGQGVAFGIPVDTLTQIGYPASGRFDGREEYMCASTSYTSNGQGGYSHYCDMTPGSSGGGWLTSFDSTSGTGYVVGVNSTILVGRDISSAAVLGQTALDLYTELDG